MQKWEYAYGEFDPRYFESCVNHMNKLGSLGWELVTQVPVPGEDPKVGLLFKIAVPPICADQDPNPARSVAPDAK